MGGVGLKNAENTLEKMEGVGLKNAENTLEGVGQECRKHDGVNCSNGFSTFLTNSLHTHNILPCDCIQCVHHLL